MLILLSNLFSTSLSYQTPAWSMHTGSILTWDYSSTRLGDPGRQRLGLVLPESRTHNEVGRIGDGIELGRGRQFCGVS